MVNWWSSGPSFSHRQSLEVVLDREGQAGAVLFVDQLQVFGVISQFNNGFMCSFSSHNSQHLFYCLGLKAKRGREEKLLFKPACTWPEHRSRPFHWQGRPWSPSCRFCPDERTRRQSWWTAGRCAIRGASNHQKRMRFHWPEETCLRAWATGWPRSRDIPPTEILEAKTKIPDDLSRSPTRRANVIIWATDKNQMHDFYGTNDFFGKYLNN